MGLTQEKHVLRRLCRERLASLTEEYKVSAGEAIARLVMESPAFRKAGCVMLYMSLPGEPDTGRLAQAALAMGKTVCLPRCMPPCTLEAVPVHSLETLVPGAYGIPAPAEGETVDPAALDLILVPCLASDPSGGRLGHGAGYYDRFLCRTRAVLFCLCFGKMMLARIPMSTEDIEMDAVVTEDGIRMTRIHSEKHQGELC